MSDLTDVLDRFNRKERNLLVRDILGHSPVMGLPLSDNFRERVGIELGNVAIPPDAWWATDYHLNWIAGALAIWRDGEQAIDKHYDNDMAEAKSDRWLIERNQEDADLLIAFQETLILIEVKAFGSFTNKQIDSKVQRWRLLNQFCKTQKAQHKLRLHFMLMSRKKPTGLHAPPADFLLAKGKWPHVVLDVPSAAEKLKVTGKQPGAGSPAFDPRNWFVVRVSQSNNEEIQKANLTGENDTTDFDVE